MPYKIKLGAFFCAFCLLLTACGSSEPEAGVTDPDVSVSESTVIATEDTAVVTDPTDTAQPDETTTDTEESSVTTNDTTDSTTDSTTDGTADGTTVQTDDTTATAPTLGSTTTEGVDVPLISDTTAASTSDVTTQTTAASSATATTKPVSVTAGKTTVISTTKPTAVATTPAATTQNTKPADTTRQPSATQPSATQKPSTTVRPSTTVTSTTAITTTTRRTKPIITASGTTTTAPTTTTTAPTDYPDKHPGTEWKLIWSDEFNGSSLDKNKWNVEVGGNGLIYKKESNVKVEKGKCVLTLLRDSSVSGYQYTGTSITTAKKFSFQYGRLEFRAKLPYGYGVWPALWTMGDYYLTTNDELGWPRCGEIDVMELVGAGGADGKDVYRENKKVTGNLHWGVNRENHQGSYSYHFLADGAAANNYHLYAIEWDENEIVWFVDNIETHRVSLDDPTMLDSFHQKHWIIMNVALYEANQNTPLPQSMYVDYVRVYQKK